MSNETLENTTVAELVANDYRTAEIFKKHGIDFCCGGKKSLAQVCDEKKVNRDALQAEIDALQLQSKDRAQNFNEWSLTFLIDYILNNHHSYIKNNLQLITEFADKVAKVHGEHEPQNVEISKLWKELAAELSAHMETEESLVFPHIKRLEQDPNGTMSRALPILLMEHEHESAGNLMKEIQRLSNDFTPPAHACNTYRVLYAKLKEFCDDLFQHIHLENNILFPKAVILERGAAVSSGDSCSI